MAQFKFAVTETRNFEMQYEVEADTLEEAREKAETGDTTFEVKLGCCGVADRFVAELLQSPRPDARASRPVAVRLTPRETSDE